MAAPAPSNNAPSTTTAGHADDGGSNVTVTVVPTGTSVPAAGCWLTMSRSLSDPPPNTNPSADNAVRARSAPPPTRSGTRTIGSAARVTVTTLRGFTNVPAAGF